VDVSVMASFVLWRAPRVHAAR